MPYATASDMIARFGSTELIRMTTPEGQAMDAIDTAAVDRAIAEASGQVDSYLRTRYAVPLVAVPVEITGLTCRMARYSLAHGENREPTEQMRMARKEDIAWLEGIAKGLVTLDGVAPANPAQSGARSTDRARPFDADALGLW
jgi:phage gp36-like protein